MFKRGDEIRCIKRGNKHTDETGRVDVVAIYPYKNNGTFTVRGRSGHCYEPDQLIKIGGSTMSKYEELKDRISRVEGWTKEADDIIQELRENGADYDFGIIHHMNSTSGRIHIMRYKNNKQSFYRDEEAEIAFSFYSQCEKNTAFKKALMWLLDNSDIKKESKKDTLQQQLDEFRVKCNKQIAELEAEIRG